MVKLEQGILVGRGRYELRGFLHAGGAGVVWSAVDRRADPPASGTASCAIKVLDAGNGGREIAAVEAEVAVRVQHAAVIAVRNHFEEDGRSFIVMDLARGSLADLVERTGRLRPSEAVSCAIAIAEGLGAAHRAGVVHRDVKPHNVLVRADGQVALSDFGASRAYLAGGGNTRTGVGIGTVPFLAPEQRRDPRAVRPSTDVYALGVTVAWLLLGVVPDDLWSEEAHEHLRAAGVSSGLVAALARCGARKPEDRPEHGDAAAALFRECGVVPAPLTARMPDWGETALREPIPSGSPSSRLVVRRAVLLSAAPVAAALAVGGGIGFSWHGPSTSDDLAGVRPCIAGQPAWETSHYPRRNDEPPGLREATPPAIADFDADGFTDVAFPHQLDATIRIFWGNGQRRLSADFTDIRFERTSFGSAPATGDFDEDGDIDLIAFNRESASLVSLVNGGKRQFSIGTRISQPTRVGRLQLADWDGDGHLDLLINPAWGDTEFDLDVRSGDGRGNFASEQLVPLPKSIILDPSDSTAWGLTTNEAWQIPVRAGRAVLDEGQPTRLPVPIQALSGNGWPVIGLHRSADGVIPLRISDEQPPCKLPPVGPVAVPSFGDIDGDGRLDAAWAETCAYCTSSYFAVFG